MSDVYVNVTSKFHPANLGYVSTHFSTFLLRYSNEGDKYEDYYQEAKSKAMPAIGCS